MKRLRTVIFVGCVLGVSGSALALPRGPGPSTGRGATANVQLSAYTFRSPTLQKRLSAKIQKDGKEITAAEALAKFDANQKVDVGNGESITVKEILDAADEMEQQAAKDGGSLTALRAQGWAIEGTAAKRDAQKAAHKQELEQLKKNGGDFNSSAPPPEPPPEPSSPKPLGPRAGLSPNAPPSTQAPPGPAPTTAPTTAPPTAPSGAPPKPPPVTCTTCTPKEPQAQVRWEKALGDKKVVAAYTSFSAGEKTPNLQTESCSAVWDNGISLHGKDISLIKFMGDASATTVDNKRTTAGNAALYLIGQSTPVFKKSGSVKDERLDRTFKSPKVSLGFSIVPLVRIEGGIDGSATMALRPTVASDATAPSLKCDLGVRPELSVNVNPDVRLIVGHKKLVKLAQGGIKAQLTVVDARLPTTLNLLMNTEQPSLKLDFMSSLDVNFLKGRVYAWYQLHDLCVAWVCLLDDILHIKTKGELELWEDKDGFPYHQALVNRHGAIAINGLPSGGGAARQ